VESISQASTKHRHDSAEIPSSPSQATDEQLSDEGQELEDDIMDISRSEIDEAEIPGYSPQPPVAEGQQTAGSVDDEESYEPPSDISGLQQHNLDLSTRHPTSDSAIVETNLPKVTNDHLSTDKQGADPSPSDDDFAHNADGQSEERTSHRSTSLADASDSDDYEPPEPVPLASESMVGARMTIDDPKLSPLSTVDVSSDITPVRPGPLQGLENNNTAKTVVPDARKVSNIISHLVYVY